VYVNDIDMWCVL
jgi:hypothetical protein